MEILSAAEMAAADRYMIERLDTPETLLMERAGKCVFAAIEEDLAPLWGKRALVLCGAGGNGGDGFVVSRLLLAAGANVKTVLCADPSRIRGAALEMLKKLETLCPVLSWEEYKVLAQKGPDIAVDALLGTGSTGAPRPPMDEAIEYFNSLDCYKISVDIPSGVDADRGLAAPLAVAAQRTVTFCREKYAHRLFPARSLCGRITLCDIGIKEEAVAASTPSGRLFTAADGAPLLGPPKENAHKGDMGRLIIAAGSEGMAGAAVMAATAALRTGAGLVTAALPRAIYNIAAARLTEAMTLPLEDNGAGAFSQNAAAPLIEKSRKADAMAVGCGLSVCRDTEVFLMRLIEAVEIPMVIDADGINLLSRNINILKGKKAPLVLTPHPGEMARLISKSVAAVEGDRIRTAVDFARRSGVVVVLKGPGTVTAAPDGRFFINTTGNGGMATGGSGDVLTGIIATLLAQGIDPFMAAACGVFLHGMAGDMAAKAFSMRGLCAGDIIGQLPFALKRFEE